MNEKIKWAVSTLIAALGISIPVVIYMISTADKVITFDIFAKSELISQDVDGLELKMNGNAIDSANIFLVRLENSGESPIVPEDYERKSYIEFDGEVYSVKIKKKSPENLSLDYTVKDKIIEISPLLLNPGEYFDLEIMSSTDSPPKLNSRIAGTEIRKKIYENENDLRNKVIRGVASFLLIVFYARSFRMAFYSAGYFSRILVKASNITLAGLCMASGYYFLEGLFGADNTVLEVVATFIPIGIGVFLASKEIEYNKQSQATQ